MESILYGNITTKGKTSYVPFTIVILLQKVSSSLLYKTSFYYYQRKLLKAYLPHRGLLEETAVGEQMSIFPFLQIWPQRIFPLGCVWGVRAGKRCRPGYTVICPQWADSVTWLQWSDDHCWQSFDCFISWVQLYF